MCMAALVHLHYGDTNHRSVGFCGRVIFPQSAGSMATSNPLFINLAIPQPHRREWLASERMTLAGTLHKTGLLLGIFLFAGFFGWQEFRMVLHWPTRTTLYLLLAVTIFSLLGGWALVWISVRHKDWSATTAPMYALLEGLLLGMFSSGEDMRFHGIAGQAVGVTIAMSAGLLAAYRLGWIRVTDSFNRKLSAAISGVAIFYLANIALTLAGVRSLTAMAGVIPSILISVVVVGIAALSLVSDFDAAVRCADEGNPAYMEWYAAMGLIVSLVWLYIEVVNLISKARRAEEEPL